MELTVEQLAKRLNAELVGDGTQPVNSAGPLESAGSDTVVFINSDKQLNILESFLENSKAGAILVNKHIDTKISSIPQLIVKDVNSALIEMLNIFAPELKPAPKGIAPTATVAENAQIAENASIGANVAIEDGVRIGQNTIIAAGCKIGQNCKIGSNSQLDCNVAIYHNCTIGNNVIIQANTTIGSLGFGYYFIDGSHKLIPHNGAVVIEDFVEIGANCCIDRAKFNNTVIGAGTKIDNLVHIAHNVITGKCCLIAGQAGIAGSTRIGDGVVLAGKVGVNDNIKIGDGAIVGACSGVFRDVPDGQKMFGSPATKLSDALKTVSASRRLPNMLRQLKQLTKRVESLETAKNNKK